MRKIMLILAVLTTTFVSAQFNFQLEAGKEVKGAIEWEYHTDNSMGYAYSEWLLNGNKATMNWAQVFWEQKFWKAPVFIHGEFRTGMTTEYAFGNTYLLGAAIGLVQGKYGYLTLEPLYRYENKQHGYQMSVVSGFQYKSLLFTSYVDLWAFDKPKETILCSENKLFYNLYKGLSIGANIELGYNYRHEDKWSFYPFGVIRYNIE